VRATEARRRDTCGLDRLDTSSLVERLLSAHDDVPAVVRAAAGATARAVDATTARLCDGGRLVYLGSGTPGRLGEADASELPPTFGWPPDRLVVVRARPAAEGMTEPDEDRPERGADDVAAACLGASDIVVALASSGSTPFTLGGARRASERGALVIAVVSVSASPLGAVADIEVRLETGAEPIMGSTRMRAGLAQRLWLTVFSTAVMVRLGRTHDNLMVNVAPILEKLRRRRVAILREATGVGEADAMHLLDAAGDDLRVAIVMQMAGATAERARCALDASQGRTREAVESVRA